MRRSCAPSMKRSQPGEGSAFVAKRPLVPHSDVAASKQPAASASSTKENVCALNDSATFKVVWGKISTRKHKTWEGDGTLEVSGRSAVLRDETGKVISTASGLKLEEVTEGIQMIVGSKEVEVLERIAKSTQSTVPVSNRSENVAPENKMPRISKPPSTSFKAPAQRTAEPDPPEPISPLESLTTKDSFSKVEPKPSVPVAVNRQFKPIAMHSAADGGPPQDDGQGDVLEPLFMKKPSFEHRFHHNPNNELTVADVQVATCLTKHLRPHQREGVAFLYECVTGMRMMESPGDGYYGAILADEMGLGKTLQCIALMYTLLKTGPYGKPLARRILIVTPSSLVENWDREITKWLRNERLFTFIVGPHNKLRLYAQSLHIPVLIISYEMLAKQIDELETVKFDLIFCDEGHRLKNSNVKAFGVLSKLECRRRVLITGTPIQNDLAEFYSLINFVNPGVLGSYQDFKARYETPIIISQRPGVLPQSIELGIERLNELNGITGRFVLRRTQEVINRYLPEKHELVIFCHPSELQTKLLRTALTFYDEERNGSNAITPLQLITILKKICNHPSLVKVTGGRGDPESLLHRLADQLPDWQAMGPSDSTKLAIIDTLLEDLIVKQEKVVIVSYYNKTLDMIAGLCEHYNYKHSRLDGSTVASDRSKIVATFNNAASDIFILLLSAKAGGAGLNLIGASRLVLYDNDWNPANDLQAMSRVWRDGQSRTVFIYRLLTAFSIEERIFQRQISKTSLSGTVVDQRRNMNNLQFSDEELKDLFSFVDPQHANDCLTHSLLECPCAGIGVVPEPEVAEDEPVDELDRLLREPPMILLPPETESRYRVRHGARGGRTKTKYALKMQELMRWEHHRSPVSESVMEQLGLARCSEEVVFLFRNIVSDGK
ncbi:DNA repair and recombination protein RAD54B-like [Anopheles aquasalis]|uniref:DNA repair and recombination protein RAD54B-like n=1 Tax=Anopheles aquasalis TaxID=42839 RepID=UPI00215A7F5B|nr:DNA repair and recombination protein RAD54B-like [Anopheles aquasalis]